MRSAFPIWLALVYLAACSRDTTVTLPPDVADTMASAVVAVESNSGAMEVTLARLDSPLVVEIGEDAERVRVLLYEDDITHAFELSGRLADTSPSGRRLPMSNSAWRWDVDPSQRETPDWQPAQEPTGRLATFRTQRSRACSDFVADAAPLGFSGGDVANAYACAAPCAMTWALTTGEVFHNTRVAPLEVVGDQHLTLTSTAGDPVAVAFGGVWQFIGYQDGFTFTDSGAPRWVPAPWTDDNAVDYLYMTFGFRQTIFSVTEKGAIYRYDDRGWRLLHTLVPSTLPTFFSVTPPNLIGVFRGTTWVTIIDDIVAARTLPVNGNIVSRRWTDLDELPIEVIGTDAGEVLYQSEPPLWKALDDTGTRAPVVGVITWPNAWLVFDADGRLYQQRLDDTACEPLIVLEERVLGMISTNVGYYVWGETSFSLVHLAP